jgi:predicted small integral membrane protein
MDGTPGAGRHLRRRQDPGLLGCGIGLVVWMGLFGVVGGAYFQMWQTPAGSASLGGAFQYQAMCAFVLLFVNMPDA